MCLQCTRDALGIYLWFTCDVLVIYLGITYDVLMIYVRVTYDLHMIYLSFTHVHFLYDVLLAPPGLRTKRNPK